MPLMRHRRRRRSSRSRVAPLGKVSVVMIAARRLLPAVGASRPRSAGQRARDLARSAAARRSRPVEATNTSFGWQPSSLAAAGRGRARRPGAPARPVKALALPELTTIARALPPGQRLRGTSRPAAAAVSERVKTPATVRARRRARRASGRCAPSYSAAPHGERRRGGTPGRSAAQGSADKCDVGRRSGRDSFRQVRRGYRAPVRLRLFTLSMRRRTRPRFASCISRRWTAGRSGMPAYSSGAPSLSARHPLVTGTHPRFPCSAPSPGGCSAPPTTATSRRLRQAGRGRSTRSSPSSRRSSDEALRARTG